MFFYLFKNFMQYVLIIIFLPPKIPPRFPTTSLPTEISLSKTSGVCCVLTDSS